MGSVMTEKKLEGAKKKQKHSDYEDQGKRIMMVKELRK